jgi:hypothetical protein
MKRKLYAGTTSEPIPIFAYDSTKTDGSGLGGLTSTTSGLVAEYRRKGQSSWTSITLAAGTLGTYVNSGSAGSGGGFVADGSLTGAYEFCVPDAALASGVDWVLVRLRGATNMVPVQVEIELDAVNYQSASGFISGINSLAPPSNWNLTAIDGSGRVDVGKIKGTASAGAAGYVGIDWGNVNAPTTTVNLSGTTISTSQAVASVSGNVGGSVAGSVGSVTGSVGSVSGVTFPANFSSLAIDASTGGVTVKTNNDKTGYGMAASQTFSTTGSVGSVSGAVGSVAGAVSVGSVTSGVIAADVWNASRASYTTGGSFGQGVASVQGNVTGSVASVTGSLGGNVVGSVGSVTGNVGGNIVGSVGSIAGVAFPANFSVLAIAATTGQVGIDLTNIKQATSPTTLSNITIPTVSSVTSASLNLDQPVPASNTAQTVGDALNAARAQGFGKWVLSGTTLTLYAPDGATAVRTFTLDSATAPTQRS